MAMKSISSSVVRKLFSLGVAAVTTLAIAPNTLAAGFADFLFVVDESESMKTEHDWLTTMISDLETALQSKGLGTGTEANRFGLVGFGSSRDYANAPFARTFDMDLDTAGVQSFGSANLFSSAVAQLNTIGFYEDGYEAIDFALNEYSFRQDAAVNIVLVTDEDRDGTRQGSKPFNFNNTLAALQGKNALLNAVVNNTLRDGDGNRAVGVDSQGNAFIADGNGGFTTTANGNAARSGTKTDYIDLAWATGNSKIGGAAWDLNILRNGGDSATSFTKAFVEVKSEEALKQNPGGGNNQEVPEPASILGLLVVGSVSIATSKKHRRIADSAQS